MRVDTARPYGGKVLRYESEYKRHGQLNDARKSETHVGTRLSYFRLAGCDQSLPLMRFAIIEKTLIVSLDKTIELSREFNAIEKQAMCVLLEK